jgi:ribosome-binding protein aMBF1 (putative translation factor)
VIPVDAGYNQYGCEQRTQTLLSVQAIQRKLGAKVRALRKSRGWSQDVLADRSGLHRAHVGEIERGESNVTLQTLKIIADTLDVTMSELLRSV